MAMLSASSRVALKPAMGARSRTFVPVRPALRTQAAQKFDIDTEELKEKATVFFQDSSAVIKGEWACDQRTVQPGRSRRRRGG